MSLSGYHDWRRLSPSRPYGLEGLKKRVKESFDSSGSTYGIGRICGILRGEGIGCSYVKVKRLMASMGLKSIHLKRRSRSLTDSRNARDDSYVNHAKGSEARLAMFKYIEGFYNTRRVQKRLGYKSLCNL